MDKKTETFVSSVVIQQVISRPGIWVCVLSLSGDLPTYERAAPLVEKFHSWQCLDWIGCLPIYASWTGDILFYFFIFWKVRRNPRGPSICSSICISSIIPGEKHQEAVYTMFACVPSRFSPELLSETLGTLDTRLLCLGFSRQEY